jgi:hypothetical protein
MGKIIGVIVLILLVFLPLSVGASKIDVGLQVIAGNTAHTLTKEVMYSVVVFDTTVQSTFNSVGIEAVQIGSVGSGGVKEIVYTFDKDQDEELNFSFYAPSDIDGSQNVSFQILWIPGDGWSSGTYLWICLFLIKDTNGVLLDTVYTAINSTVTPSNATDLIKTTFSTTIDLDAGQTLSCKLYRDVSGDTGDDDAWLRMIGISYTAFQVAE